MDEQAKTNERVCKRRSDRLQGRNSSSSIRSKKSQGTEASMSESLVDLRGGAEACLSNSQRLLDDAITLFEKESYPSCFMLTQLCLEELAKGFMLIEKEAKHEVFSRKEWEEITSKGKSHKKKLAYLQEIEDNWAEECLKGYDMSYIGILKEIVSDLPWAHSIEEFRIKMSEAYYKWRMN